MYYSRRYRTNPVVIEQTLPLSNQKSIIHRDDGNSPKLIEELMRKSLELAQTAEQVADKNEQTLIVQDNIHTHL